MAWSKLIEGQGGRLRCNQEVREIVVQDGTARGVRLASGETIDADIVVSNADFGLDLPASAAVVARGRAGPTGASSARAIP